MMGLARYTFGEGLSYLACCARQALAFSGPAIARTPTTPLARCSGYIHVSPSAALPGSGCKPCTCMSQRPGIRNFPRPRTDRDDLILFNHDGHAVLCRLASGVDHRYAPDDERRCPGQRAEED